MQLGIVGLGRMGANIARRLMRHGHSVVVHDVNPDPIAALAGEGAEIAVPPQQPLADWLAGRRWVPGAQPLWPAASA